MFSTKQINEINSHIDPGALLKIIDFHADRMHEDDQGILGYCPLHGDHIIKTLALDKNKKTFRCRYTLCPGFKGGTMVDFWSIYKGVSIDKAGYELVQMFQLPIELPVKDDLIKKELSLAEKALRKNNFDTGREHIKNVLEYEPDNAQANKLLAMLDYEQNASTQFFSQLSKMKDLAQHKNESTQILDLLSQISQEKEPSIKITHKKLEILEALGSEEAALSEIHALALLYRNNNNLQKALVLYNTIIEYDPTNIEAKDAIAQLLPRVENQQITVDLFFKLYENHMNSNNIEAALQDLEEVISLEPTNGVAHEELSNLYVSLGNPKKACTIRLNYARALYEQNNITEAQSYAADSLELDPENEEVYLFLAKIYLENNLGSAKANHYYLMAGKICMSKNKYQEALQYLEKLSPDAKENISSLKALIKAYIHLKNEDYAVFYSLKLVDRYVAENKFDKAEIIFSNITQIFPNNSILKEKHVEFKKIY